MLISDLFDANAERAISELAGTRCDVAVLHTLSPDELDPPLEGDLRLVDRETGEGVDITADLSTLDAYSARLAAGRRARGGQHQAPRRVRADADHAAARGPGVRRAAPPPRVVA